MVQFASRLQRQRCCHKNVRHRFMMSGADLMFAQWRKSGRTVPATLPRRWIAPAWGPGVRRVDEGD